MGLEIIRGFSAYRKEGNPLEEKLIEKRKMIEIYQTPRVAKEFYETIRQIFTDAKVPVKRGLFLTGGILSYSKNSKDYFFYI